MIREISHNTYVLCCDYCGWPVTSSFGDTKRPSVRGGVECPECLELVDEAVANAYIEAMQKAGKKRRWQEAGQETA